MSYVAVVLDEKSRNLLIEFLGELIPNDWEVIRDFHMTLYMGAFKPNDIFQLGEKVHLVANGISFAPQVIAISICRGGGISENKNPHITIAVDRKRGGKPAMSNDIPPDHFAFLDNYIDRPIFHLYGTVQQVD
jgi:hypothetical protein